MSNTEKTDETADKMIDEFKDKADKAVDDARKGETEDNPIKERIRDRAGSAGDEAASRKDRRDG